MNQCELCAAQGEMLSYEVPALSREENLLHLCNDCWQQIHHPSSIDAQHFRCLSESMWSERAAVQVLSWRLLHYLRNESWASELLEQLYLEENYLNLAKSVLFESNQTEVESVSRTVDSLGNLLAEGDSVTLIKDLEVKGANFTAKRGTLVKKISLTDNPLHVEGRVNGMQIVLVSKFLKKV